MKFGDGLILYNSYIKNCSQNYVLNDNKHHKKEIALSYTEA